MARIIRLRYENGVFKPIEKVRLPEQTVLEVPIEEPAQEDLSPEEATRKLLELLKRPHHLGKALYKNREDIYDDIA